MSQAPFSALCQIARSIRSPICHACRRQLILPRNRRTFSITPKAQEEEPTRYYPAKDWHGLEWVGTKEWIYKRKKGDISGKFFERPPVPAEQVEEQIQLAAQELVAFIKAEEPLEAIDLLPVPDQPSPFIPFDGEVAPVKNLQELDLTDLDTRFAFVKRVMKRTGRRISDAYISKCVTAADVLFYVQKRQKTDKLAKLLDEEQRLDFPNVLISPRKQTEILEDQQVGRWKVIKQELWNRDLPEVEYAIPRQGMYLKRWKGADVPTVDVKALMRGEEGERGYKEDLAEAAEEHSGQR